MAHNKKSVLGKKIKFPLAAKLIVIITIIVILSMVLVTGLSSYFFSQDLSRRSEESNYTIMQVLASRLESELKAIYISSLALLDSLNISKSDVFTTLAKQNFFTRNENIIYVGVADTWDIYNDKFFMSHDFDKALVEKIIEDKNKQISAGVAGATALINAGPYFSKSVIGLVIPYTTEYKTQTYMLVLFLSDNLQLLTETNSVFTSYAFSQDGDIFLFPDIERVKANIINLSEAPLPHIIMSNKQTEQFRYDTDGSKWMAAFQKVTFGNFIVCTTAPLNLVYEAVYAVIKQNILLTGIVVLFSILVVWFFSNGISRPVLTLKNAAEQIALGNYKLDIKPTSKDELGLLTASFMEMSEGLEERERIKETFGKFVNKEIAQKAAKGELALGGERKTATIFFSDIRSFTAISENMSPEKVVEFLNEYMTRMVECMEQTNGVVDKFIGDAIMGVWGVPVSAGSEKLDAEQAIKSMLLMRDSLIEFNKNRGTADKPIIRIGCGVNTGQCLAGQIGSSQRMEYTVIGDAVNLASRIEALNKPFATDILISENTYNLVKDKLIVEAMPPIKVKGKVAPLNIYAVVNYKDAEGPKTLQEVRELLDIQTTPNFDSADIDEVKYEIIKK